MDQTHIHLLVNHVPVIGSIFGAFVLAYGLWARSVPTKIAAYFLLIFSALGAVITYLTGEAAEETVEHIQGISKDMIEQHEDFAVIALVALIILGIASLAGLLITIKKPSLIRTTAWVILFISVISFGLVARTAYMGGEIRHTEISQAGNVQSQRGEGDHD
jgi:uncharacterized membrane protein